jgi:CubicO group peptidase (beta-lactamase class C family)
MPDSYIAILIPYLSLKKKMHKLKFKLLLQIILLSIISSSCVDINRVRTNSECPGNINITRTYWPTEVWRASSPQEQGFDIDAFLKAKNRFREVFPAATSILVVRHGYLVTEEYFNGWNKDKSLQVYSITKTVMGILTGICVREGYIDNVNRKIMDYFPEYFTNETDPRKKEITLKNALTHSTGFNDDRKTENGDWIKNTLDQTLFCAPGEKFSYSNTVPDLFSGIIKRKSGLDTKTFADKYLFTPLGITITNWDTLTDGNCLGATGLYLTPRDMAKIGYLFLNDGKWDNQRILPDGWVKESTYPHFKVDNKAYGYYLWVRPVDNNKNERSCRDLYTYYAYGHRGQYIGVIPEIDMVVVITTYENDTSRDNYYIMELIQDYLEKYLIPSVKK